MSAITGIRESCLFTGEREVRVIADNLVVLGLLVVTPEQVVDGPNERGVVVHPSLILPSAMPTRALLAL